MNPKMIDIAIKLMLGIVAVMVAFYVGARLSPVTLDLTMSREGKGQSGWPLPFVATFWDDSVVNAHQEQRFNIVYFVFDVVVVYFSILVLGYALQKVMSLVIRRHYSEEMDARVRTYAQYAFLLVFLTLVAYWGLILYVSAPEIHTGVTEGAIPVPI